MNILYIVSYVPSLVRVRSYNFIRHLAKRGHAVTVCTLWSSDEERNDISRLESDNIRVHAIHQANWRSLWNCLLALPSHTPLQAVFSWNPKLAKLSRSLLRCNGEQSFDVIHVEHLRAARYGIHLKSRYPETPVVWDSVDCITYLFEQASGQSRSGFGRFITNLDLVRTRRYEGRLPTQFDQVVISSQVDRQALINLVPDQKDLAPVSIIPNGVDWEYFSKDSGVKREPATLVLSGKMSYHANVTMALFLINEIMPIVWESRPDARVVIVGKDPPASIRSMEQNPGVTVTGMVDDIRPYLQKASAAVVPMVYGAGSQLKLFEAMACGTPVVATSRAIQAIDAVPERDVLLGDTPVEFAKQVLRLLEDLDYRQQIGRAGRRYVEDNHQWTKIAKVLEGVYHEVISTRRERRIQ